MTKLQAHRGVSSDYPENTMIAFRAAVNEGYAIIELDPKYCDVIVNSYVKLTGNTKATCERDGKTYTYKELKKENDLANGAGGGGADSISPKND